MAAVAVVSAHGSAAAAVALPSFAEMNFLLAAALQNCSKVTECVISVIW